MDPHTALINDVRAMHAADPARGGRAIAAVLALSPTRAARLLQCVGDDPEMLAAALDALAAAPAVAPAAADGNGNWRGALQEHLQRCLRRTPTDRELAYTVDTVADGRAFVATVTVDAPPATARTTVWVGDPAPSKRAAVHAAARRALDALLLRSGAT